MGTRETNRFLMTVFTNEEGEAFTCLQLLIRIMKTLNEWGDLAGQVEENTANIEKIFQLIAEFNKKFTKLEGDISAIAGDLTDLEKRVAALEAEVAGVNAALDTLNGEVV